MKRTKLAAAAALACAFAIASSPVQAKVDFGGYFDFEAHRGGRDARPENTLWSYAYAIEQGATSIECDMQLSGDGQIVMSHNPILNPDITRGPDGKYVKAGAYDIRKMKVADIKKFDVSRIDPKIEYHKLHGRTQVLPEKAEIPTLEELLKLLDSCDDKSIILNIETKSYPDPAEKAEHAANADPEKFVKAFNALVKKHNMEDRVVLQSFDWRTLEIEHRLNPKISLSALWSQQPSWGRSSENLRPYEEGASPWLGGLDIDDFKGDAVKAAHSIGADVISPYYKELSADMVDEAHALGMKVVPWTVNDERDMAMLYDMGVDGIISDKPWVLRNFLEKRGAKIHGKRAFKSDYSLSPDHNEVKSDKAKGGADASY